MAAEDPDRLVAELDEEARAMQRRSEELGHEVARAREDWERKRADPSVPGAPPPEGQSDEEHTSDHDERPPER